MVKNSFIEKTYVVGTHWNCLGGNSNVYLQHVTKNKENYSEIYTFQVSSQLFCVF